MASEIRNCILRRS